MAYMAPNVEIYRGRNTRKHYNLDYVRMLCTVQGLYHDLLSPHQGQADLSEHIHSVLPTPNTDNFKLEVAGTNDFSIQLPNTAQWINKLLPDL